MSRNKSAKLIPEPSREKAGKELGNQLSVLKWPTQVVVLFIGTISKWQMTVLLIGTSVRRMEGGRKMPVNSGWPWSPASDSRKGHTPDLGKQTGTD